MGAILCLQCNLFGPEPGYAVFPAQIDSGDSAAVRAILDSNNLRTASVRRAIDPWSKGRITTLKFDSLGLDSFAFSKDFQKLDSLITIDLSNNQITKIIVSDTLKYRSNGVSIDLEQNQPTAFPIGILKIKGLFSVLVQYNSIDTISQALMASGFRQIFFDYNKLCSV
jgi:Leucine-rich repeat (LRR) protein